MTECKLIIETHGICTHFMNGVVSGVPHRVVLPNTTHIQAATIALASDASRSPVLYYLVPHFPQFTVADCDFDLTVPGLLRQGDVVTGLRLQVTNCCDLGITYENEIGPALTTYYPDYTFSNDVVLNGRASCYLDVYGGTIRYVQPLGKDGAGHARIEMHTDGPAELLVTPLTQSNGVPPAAYRVTLPQPDGATVRLKVRNIEPLREKHADEDFGSFDFLLHYLTAQGGIPPVVAERTPGMLKNLYSVSPERMAGALRELADAVAPPPDDARPRRLQPEGDLTSSCAPSHYP